LKEQLRKKRERKIRDIESFFNEKIINMIGKNNLLFSDYVDWNKNWEIENYLTDVRKFEDLPNNMCYTRDNYDRVFFFVKLKVSNPFKFNYMWENYTILTISQKYSDIQVFYASDPNNYSIYGYSYGIFIDDDNYCHFQKFFKEKMFSYIDNPYSFNKFPIYSKIEIL